MGEGHQLWNGQVACSSMVLATRRGLSPIKSHCVSHSKELPRIPASQVPAFGPCANVDQLFAPNQGKDLRGEQAIDLGLDWELTWGFAVTR
jgi:hypothetical protein